VTQPLSPEAAPVATDAELGEVAADHFPAATEMVPSAASPAPEHAGGSINDEQREAVREAVAQALSNAYDCHRVWEAWEVGTMGSDDFSLVAEDDNRVAEIADAAIEAMRPSAPPASEPGEGRWSEGICGDGAAILCDGAMVPVEEVEA